MGLIPVVGDPRSSSWSLCTWLQHNFLNSIPYLAHPEGYTLFPPCSLNLDPYTLLPAGYSINCPSGQLQTDPVILSLGEAMDLFSMGSHLHPFLLELGSSSTVSAGVTVGQTSVVGEGG